MNKTLEAIGSGLIGACALTLVHQTAKQLTRKAPRADVLGMRAIAKGLRAIGRKPPKKSKLHNLALVGDIAANTLYYSLVGLGGSKRALLLGPALGAAAGVGAVTLPGGLGLGQRPSARTPQTAAMTVGWYLAGGLAAAAAYKYFESE